MKQETIEWLVANGFEKGEMPKELKEFQHEQYMKEDKLSRGISVMTTIRETREMERIISRTEHPYVVEVELMTNYWDDVKLNAKVFFNGDLEVLKKALKACEKGFWDKVAKYGKVLMVAGALHDGYKWIGR